MPRPFRRAGAALPALLLALTSAPLFASSELELDPRDALPHCKITLQDAIERALAKQPGHAIEAALEGEFEDGAVQVLFEVAIVTKDYRLVEVAIDAKSGELLETEEEDDEDARAEAVAILNRLRHYELSLGQLIEKAGALVRGAAVAAELEMDDEGPECEVRIANGRYLFELDLEGRAGHLVEIELVRDRDEHEERHGQQQHDKGAPPARHGARLPLPLRADDFPVHHPLQDGTKFVAEVTHPYFPLAQVRRVVLASADAKVVREVEKQKKTIAGVACTVLVEAEHEDGALAEISRNYFAQDEQGNVWYFGEDVDDYEDGKVVGHGGAWLVRKNAQEPCLFLPATLRVGSTFRRENSPPHAQEFDMIGALDARLQIGDKTFRDLLVVLETDRLGRWQEKKFYAKGIGLISENGELNLVEITK